MKILTKTSLAATVDAINDATFFGNTIPRAEKTAAAKWILSRQGQPGAYAGMFAPTKKDFAAPIKLFTGEGVGTRAGVSHILGEEACRALILLNPGTKAAEAALASASGRIIQCLAKHQSEGRTIGMFCCGKCSAALWRHVAAGGLGGLEMLLDKGVEALKTHRDGKGRWRVFPYHYTLLALSEMDTRSAVAEMRYAAKSCERLVNRKVTKRDKYTTRRRALAEKVLAKC